MDAFTLYAWKKKKKTPKWTLLRFTLLRQKWKNAKYCVQNPVRLGQSGLDNKLLILKRVGKVENWKWKTFAVQTILQKQSNMAKVAIGSLPDSSENARTPSEILRGPTKKIFRQIAWKLTELEQFQFSEKHLQCKKCKKFKNICSAISSKLCLGPRTEHHIDFKKALCPGMST